MRTLRTTHSRGPKWFNAPVVEYVGTLAEVRTQVPLFIRQPLGFAQPDSPNFRFNGNLDTIVRCPTAEDESFVPVGVVSGSYGLLQHRRVVDVASEALVAAGVSSDTVVAALRMTEFGERMELSLQLPNQYSFDPGDGYPMTLQLECLNSVDGTTRFRAMMGWFRFVCSNGLVVGVTRSDIRRRHAGEVDLGDLQAVITAGVDECEAEVKRFGIWRQTKVSSSKIVMWIEQDVRKLFGFKAAARAYHIAKTGFDAEVVGNYKEKSPTNIEMKVAERVQGAPLRSDNLFDLSQILAWLATQRRDVQEQLEWRERIIDVMQPLTSAI